MAKLYFRYGAMNSGKSTALLQAAYNYEERGQAVLIAKPAIDTKGANQVESRLGMSREVDFLLGANENAQDVFREHRDRLKANAEAALVAGGPSEVACLLVDEAQFFTPKQIDDLFRIAVEDRVPVLAYGIRTDFQTAAFPGSRRLLEIAHSLEELKTICRCGRKAVFNGRVIDGVFVFDGDQVAIDAATAKVRDVNFVTYESLCGSCYLEESQGLLSVEP